MKNFFTKIHYNTNTNITEKLLCSLLTPASIVYSSIAEVRNFLYKAKIIKTYMPDVLTISVGNLTTGGTGKTPITAAIANHLTAKGYKVAILSRGYGSKLNSKEINVISDGTNIFYEAQIGGDEPVWLAQNCPKCVVLTSSNRVQIAKYAQKIGCTALILDDGFQHQKLGRNINIAVVDIDKQFGNKAVLPCGPLRESYKNIKRADKIIIVNKNIQKNEEKIQQFSTWLKNLNQNADISICNAKVDKIYEIHSNKIFENSTEQKALAFSAIGQPEQFYNLLKQTGINIAQTISFADHHCYCEKDIEKLFEEAKNMNTEILITTEKDAVKINPLTQKAIYALKLGIDWDAETIL